MNISGCVILYNPDQSVIGNISSYIDNVDKLYVFDNSEFKNEELIEKLKSLNDDKILYMSQGKNLGIARALNICCDCAIKDNYDWILTMDQDSSFNSDKYNLFKATEELEYNITALITPFHSSKYDDFFKKEPNKTIKYEELHTAMTSGNLLNLKIYKILGGFIDELFIDEVDGEYCFRIIDNNFKIILVNNCILTHNLGNITKHTLIYKSVLTSNHNYIRRYYITRNRLFVHNMYKNKSHYFSKTSYKFKLKPIIIDTIKIILYEKNKLKKLKYSIMGYLDFKRNRLGPLKH